LTHFVSTAIRIGFLGHWHRQTLFFDNSIGVAVDSGINAYAEKMLVILADKLVLQAPERRRIKIGRWLEILT